MRAALLLAAVVLAGALAGCPRAPDPTAPETTTLRVVASTLTPHVGEAVSFRVESPIPFTLQFGDGAAADGTDVAHAFDTPGLHVVAALPAGDAHAALVPAYVDVAPPVVGVGSLTVASPPVPVLVATARVVAPGTDVVFDALSSFAWARNPAYRPFRALDAANAPVVPDVAGVAAFEWDLGEAGARSGNATAAGRANATFTTPGAHVVRVTVVAASGARATAAHTVLVVPPGAAVSGGVRNPAVFVSAVAATPRTVDPAVALDGTGAAIVQNVYDTLLAHNRSDPARFEPVLAEAVPSTENGGVDGLRYTFRLRAGVRFHDGSPVDAAAVKFSLDRVVLMGDPTGGAPLLASLAGAGEYLLSSRSVEDRARYLAAGGVEVVDERTVRLRLDAPDPGLFAKLTGPYASVVSPAAFRAAHAERRALWGVDATADGLPPPPAEGRAPVTRDPWADANAAGSGPFTLRAIVPHERAILDRAASDRARVETVVLRVLADPEARLIMLLAGDADDADVPASHLPLVAGRAGVRVVAPLHLDVMTVVLGRNVTAGENCPRDRATGARACDAFADPELRAAVVRAFDRDRFLRNVTGDRAVPLASALPAGLPGHAADLAPRERDVAAARAHVAASRHPGGLLNVVLATNAANEVRMEALRILKVNLAEIGIEARVVGLGFEELVRESQAGSFPAWMIGWTPTYAWPDDFAVPFLDARSGAYAQAAGLADPALQARVDAAVAEADPARQAPLWEAVDRAAHETDAHLFVAQARTTHVERTWVAGYTFHPMDAGHPTFGRYADAAKV